MGLRKEFLLHKKKTVESFNFVRADIAAINNHLGHLRNAVSSIGSKASMMDNEMSNLGKAIDKYSAEVGIYHSHNLGIQSKIENINKSVSNLVNAIGSFKNNTNRLISENQRLSKELSGSKNAIKKLFSVSKAQSSKNAQINFALRRLQAEIKKAKSLGSKAGKSKSKAISRKTITKIVMPKKIVTKTVTPKRKTITEIKK